MSAERRIIAHHRVACRLPDINSGPNNNNFVFLAALKRADFIFLWLF